MKARFNQDPIVEVLREADGARAIRNGRFQSTWGDGDDKLLLADFCH